MAMNNFVVSARYDTVDAAESDKAVRHLYPTSGLIDTCDAAVITRDRSGRVCIVAKQERPRKTRMFGGRAQDRSRLRARS
jgi:uncharacterized membrane protein